VLAGCLAHHRGTHPLVVGVAGGGVVVAAEVAAGIGGSLRAVAVAELEAPGGAGLAIGGVGPDGVPLVEEHLMAGLGLRLQDLTAEVRRGTARAQQRQRAYRPVPDAEVAGRTVVVVDEGMATGLALRTVLHLMRRVGPALLVAAAPVGLPSAVDLIAAEADEVVCPRQPLRLHTVGEWYDDFPEVSDDEAALLVEAAGL